MTDLRADLDALLAGTGDAVMVPRATLRRLRDALCQAPRDLFATPARRIAFTVPLEDRPELRAPRRRLAHLVSATAHLDWLLLTKRPENADRLWFDAMADANQWWLPNVWLGASVEDQQCADERIPLLLKVPAAVRFLSCEPLLGPVDLWRRTQSGAVLNLGPVETGRGLDWVICGGESGPGAKPMHPDWARSLRDQCAAARVPFLFKQWGEYFPAELLPDQGDRTPWRTSQDGHPSWMVAEHGKPRDELLRVVHKKVGKAAAGRLLDGRLHDEYPAPRAEVRHAT